VGCFEISSSVRDNIFRIFRCDLDPQMEGDWRPGVDGIPSPVHHRPWTASSPRYHFSLSRCLRGPSVLPSTTLVLRAVPRCGARIGRRIDVPVIVDGASSMGGPCPMPRAPGKRWPAPWFMSPSHRARAEDGSGKGAEA